MKKLLREPLVHFLLLGAALFLMARLVDDDAPGTQDIVITRGQIEHLVISFTRTWQRPPAQQELEGLVRDHLREEIYYREALAMGLDRDDIIIRRRLRQKLEFVAEDIAAQAEPSDDDLRAFLQAHAKQFQTGQGVTFSHVYLNPARHGDNLARETQKLLARLNRKGPKDPSQFGDPFLLDRTFRAESTSDIARDFGEAFAASIEALPAGQWHGPLESGYGVHLVQVHDRQEGRTPALEEVRDAVRREWANARRLEANRLFYEGLLTRYNVTIEPPPVEAAEAKGAGHEARP